MGRSEQATRHHAATLERSVSLLAAVALLSGCLDTTTTRIDGSSASDCNINYSGSSLQAGLAF